MSKRSEAEKQAPASRRVIEEGHETVVHVQLLVAVKKRHARIIRNEVHLGFLVSA
jgi:hypothetical protein